MRQFLLIDLPRTAIVTLFGAILLMVFPIMNGGPFFYFDSAAYVEQVVKGLSVVFSRVVGPDTPILHAPIAESGFGMPEGDGIVLAGRSVYYGFLAYLGWIISMWLPVVVQCMTLSWLVVTLFRHVIGHRWEVAALLTLAGIAVLSSASFFAGLVMPDVWAGLIILALALIWAREVQLTITQKAVLFMVISYGALVHNSHLALLAAIICLCLAVRRLLPRQDRLPLRRMTLPALALCIGIGGQFAVSTAVQMAYGTRPLLRPHITAHLVDLGPGARFAKESCPESGYALCAYAERLPVDWITFLFGQDPETGVFAVADPSVQKALSQEQVAFALRTFMAEPVATAAGLARDGLTQLWTISVEDVPLSLRNAQYIETRFPPDLILSLQQTQLYNRPELAVLLTRIIQITSAASAALLMAWAIWRVMRVGPALRGPQALYGVVAVCMAGLVINALICGVLASHYGRFQARVVWLLPLLVALVTSWQLSSSPRSRLAPGIKA